LQTCCGIKSSSEPWVVVQPVIPATQKTEAGGSWVPGQLE
jgi:hypothetical protein